MCLCAIGFRDFSLGTVLIVSGGLFSLQNNADTSCFMVRAISAPTLRAQCLSRFLKFQLH